MPLAADSLNTLEAVCDALLPPDASAWRASVPARIAGAVERMPCADDREQLVRLLRLLETPQAMALMAARWTPLSAMPRAAREGALRRMASHPVPRIRVALDVLKRLAVTHYYGDADETGANPLWPAIGYPGPLRVPAAAESPIVPLTVAADTTLECDVVVVGSGAGGGVAAGELAAEGLDVIVVERGPLADPPQFTHRELETFRRLYLDAGMRTTHDRRIAILAGSCLGGGTVVNYTTSLRLPDDVRQEWTRVSGLEFFGSAAFDDCMDAACGRLSVNTDHNRASRRDELLERGLAALGWHRERMPRNVTGCTQDDVCGYCGFGCIHDAKQSTLATYLIDAWSNGAQFLVETAVERVLVEEGRARGVIARTKSGHAVRIDARAVVASAGAIHTPALLLRSGVEGLIGRRLQLHPVAGVWGRFEEPVRPWTGTIQAIYSEELARQHEGYGVRFETAPVHPALFALALPWRGAAAFDDSMRHLSRTSVVGVLLRDRFGGRVTIDSSGAPVVFYRLSRYDRRHLARGVEGAIRILQAAGATSVTLHDGVYASFHQMGSCPMGRDAAVSVVGGTGMTHAVKELYVADASLFPTSSGVNPMIAISALAYHVSQQIKARLA